MAREKGAVPVFVTAPARTVYNANGNIKDGEGLHGGNNFAYIRAMKQLGEEAKVPVIDLFAYSCGLYKQIQELHLFLLPYRQIVLKTKDTFPLNRLLNMDNMYHADSFINKSEKKKFTG